MTDARRIDGTYRSQDVIFERRQVVVLALGGRNVRFHQGRVENEGIGLVRLERV